MLRMKIARSILGMGALAVMLWVGPGIKAEATDNTYTDEHGIEYTLDEGDKKATVSNGEQAEKIFIAGWIDNNNTRYELTAIDNGAFEGRENLEGEIELASTLKSIGSSAFSGCANMTGELIFGEHIESIGASAFCGCKNLSGELSWPNNLKNIEDKTFQACSGFSRLILPSNLESIGESAFAQCSGFDELTLPSNLKSIGKFAFVKCTGITSISEIPDTVKTIGMDAFPIDTDNTEVNDYATFVNNTTMQYGTVEVVKGQSLAFDKLYNKPTSAYIYSGEENASIEGNAIKGDEEGPAIVFCKNDRNEMVKYKVQVVSEGTTAGNQTINGELVTATPSESTTPDNSNTSSNTITSSTPYIAPQWVPTTPEDIFRFSLRGKEDVFYNVLETEDTIQMTKEIQGPLFFDAVALVQGDYKLARTYTILVNNSLVYKTEKNTKITLQIPQEIQKEGRTFRMFGVTENGKNFVLNDLDNDPATITFETNQFYAFALGYID